MNDAPKGGWCTECAWPGHATGAVHLTPPSNPFDKFLADEKARLEETLGYIADGKVYAPEDVTIVKHAAYVPMSIELAIDAGLVTEEEARARGWTPPPPSPPIPLRYRIRMRIQAWRMKTGVRVGGWIAGERLYNDDEDF